MLFIRKPGSALDPAFREPPDEPAGICPFGPFRFDAGPTARVSIHYAEGLAETINALYRAEVIHRQSWKRSEAVALATRGWVG